MLVIFAVLFVTTIGSLLLIYIAIKIQQTHQEEVEKLGKKIEQIIGALFLIGFILLFACYGPIIIF